MPEGWKWQQRHPSPLGLQPESESGLLQISSPASSPNWRGEALQPLLRTFVKGRSSVKVIVIEESDCEYGHVIRAELIHARFGDAAAWMTLHDTHDPSTANFGVAGRRRRPRDPRRAKEAQRERGGADGDGADRHGERSRARRLRLRRVRFAPKAVRSSLGGGGGRQAIRELATEGVAIADLFSDPELAAVFDQVRTEVSS